MVKLGFTKLRPHLRFVSLLGKFLRTFDIMLLVKEYFNGFNMLTKLLVDTQSLVIQLVVILLSYPGKFNTIIIVKSIDIVHDL